MLPHVNSVTACGSVFLPHAWGRTEVGDSEYLTLSASIQKYVYLHEQMLRMEAQMILNKTGDKEVAVIVTRLDPQRQRKIHLLRDRF